MLTSAIEKEILKASKCKDKPGEDRQKYLVAVTKAVEAMTDGTWDALTPKAQKWANRATAAYDDKNDIPEFPDRPQDAPEDEEEVEAAAETESAAAAVEETEMATTAKKRAGKKAAAKPKTTAKKKVAKSNGASPRRSAEGGAPTVIKRLIIDKPDITKEELTAALEKKGVKASEFTIATQRSDFRLGLRLLQEAGKLKGMTLS